MNARSLRNLQGVHADLVRVVQRAEQLLPAPLGFVVIEGLRSAKRQAELYAAGASQIQSGGRHQTGHAVDLMATINGQGRWDWPLVMRVADAMKAAAAELSIPVRWGGTWGLLSVLTSPIQSNVLHKRFPDGPHFELPAKDYPA